MTIYIVKNERNEEVAAFTDFQRAKYLAGQLQSMFAHHYKVEELVASKNQEDQAAPRPD